MKVHDIMSTKVVTVSPSTTVRDIAGLMVEKHVTCRFYRTASWWAS